ncbi:MAG: family 1 glycosylhydrolase, partial [Fimbriimonadaceae bacterium]|nr:family 1 glycosylhydrolase [Fimbriimonadaceae bacterium]
MNHSFLWGVGSSAHQIEGHRLGRGDSTWDRFSEQPNKIADGFRADVGCDHYHRWREDLALMKDLGLTSARFSLSWPRVEPTEGAVGDWSFYEALTDGYLAAGIEPIVNLFHWDFPLWAEDDGGWNDPRTADRFGRFAATAQSRLGDRVKTWLTFNEPNCFIGDGLMGTVHAPGHNWDWEQGA